MFRRVKTVPAAAVTVMAVALAGCQGHAHDTVQARSALDANRPKQALSEYNELLEVDSAKESPNVEDDLVLFVLDRAMVLQQLRDYPHSSRDLQLADKQIETLDFERGSIDDIGKYLYSDDVGPYKAPPYEKIMINTMNMVNYLARGDLNGARIEARRFAVMQKYLAESGNTEQAFAGPGSYLAGYIFERSARPEEALRFYDTALQHGYAGSLVEPIRRLALQYNVPGEYLDGLRKGASESNHDSADGGTEPDSDKAELLLVVSYGRVPAKRSVRLPIGLALTVASGHIRPHNRAKANDLAAQGLVTWVNFPALTKPKGSYGRPSAVVDGQRHSFREAFAIDKAAFAAWEDVKGQVIASAITRTITRVAAGMVARKAANDSIWGILIGLFTQATLTALDTPDTRSWATLPARVTLLRVPVEPGEHTVVLSVRGQTETHTVKVGPGEFRTLNLTVLR